MIRRIVILSLCLNAVMLSFAEIKHLNKQEFLEKVYNYEKYPSEWKFQAKRPCLIDFYATWCGPCKTMAPLLEAAGIPAVVFGKAFYEGKIDVYKIDVDAEKELSAVFGIRSIPTFLLCPVGAQPQIAQGAMPKEVLLKAIKDVLLKE